MKISLSCFAAAAAVVALVAGALAASPVAANARPLDGTSNHEKNPPTGQPAIEQLVL